MNVFFELLDFILTLADLAVQLLDFLLFSSIFASSFF